MIKAVLIDIDNTLLDFHKSANKAIHCCFSKCTLPFTDNVISTFHEVNDALWLQIEKKEITKQEMYGVRWTNIFKALGITYDGVEFEQLFRSTLSTIAEPVDNAREMLEYLYKKYPLYAASNSSYEHQHKRMTQADMLKYIQKMFVSERVGTLKPAKEFFEYCLSDIGITEPAEAVIIGDSLSADIDGGKRMGLKTIWFNPNNLAAPDNIIPDFTVDSLLKIKNIL